jgi:hypothetical protein
MLDDKFIDNILRECQSGLTDTQLEAVKLVTKVAATCAKMYYNELISVGFSKEEALKVIQAHGPLPKWEHPTTSPKSSGESKAT